MKQALQYIAVVACCLAGYFATYWLQHQQRVATTITYQNENAGAVTMAWALVKAPLPPQQVWPAGSRLEKDLVYTPMQTTKGQFTTTLQLHHGEEVYYWMVTQTDKQGKPTEVWDSGSGEYFSVTAQYDGWWKPGYFIFLAGFLPLLLYQRRAGHLPTITDNQRYLIPSYVHQFDTLRALAVLLVIVHHWLPDIKWLNILPNGRLGVNMFFVLSGFLITAILLKAKANIETNELSRGTAFKSFYIRRTLRIFPIYYLVLFVFLLAQHTEVTNHPAYYFTYTSNFLFYREQYFPGDVAHLWSLAVEEQFYLLWPWLMILVTRRWLPFVMGLFFTIGVSVNYIFTGHGWWAELLTPACFDAFAAGALLAYVQAYRHDVISKINRWYTLNVVALLLVFGLNTFIINVLPDRTVHAWLATTLIFYCLYRKNNAVANFLLNSNMLQSAGKISYGLYLYHLFIPGVWKHVNDFFARHGINLLFNQTIPPPLQTPWLFAQHIGILLLLSWVSWRIVEKPLMQLKRYFDYQSPKNITGASVVST